MYSHPKLAGVVPFFLMLSFALWGEFSSAQNYQLGNDVLDDGGVKMTSGGYIVRGSVAQTTIGKVSSPNFTAIIGFWHPYPVTPGIGEESPARSPLPKVYSLSQNYPNPVFNTTTIQYGLPLDTHVDLRVLNVSGQEVRVLVNENQKQGYYRLTWDLRGRSGNRLPNGVYFYRMKSGNFVRTKKMVILR